MLCCFGLNSNAHYWHRYLWSTSPCLACTQSTLFHCIHHHSISHAFIQATPFFGFGIWDFWGIWSMSPALPALQLLYSITFSVKVPLKQWKEEVVLIFIYTSNAVQFLSFAEDLCIVDIWQMLQKKLFSEFVSLSSRLVSYLTSDVRNTIFWYCQHKLVKFNHSVSEVLCGCYGVFFVWKPITWWVHLHYQKTVFSTYCFFVLFLFVRMQGFTFRAQLHDFCFLWSWF